MKSDGRFVYWKYKFFPQKILEFANIVNILGIALHEIKR